MTRKERETVWLARCTLITPFIRAISTQCEVAKNMSRLGNFVLVSGATGRPLDLCTVVCVKRSTVDVLLMRIPLPFEKK